MKRLILESSSISSVGYDAAREILEVEFVTGVVYQYYGVGPKLYAQLLQAPSKGRFVNFKVKEHFPYRKVL
jgi:hypothetical protein